MSEAASSGSGPDAANAAAPGREANFERLRTLLREMFQLDRGDLDFGLYRVMRLKRAEIERFLGGDLLPQAGTLLDRMTDEERDRLTRILARNTKGLREYGEDPDKAPSILSLRKQRAELRPGEVPEGEVYNHLACFFERYYRDGDFVARRRYSSGGHSSYLIPYDGEEVKLHWANADQYYIKTTENYASYVFTLGEAGALRRARFEIARAEGARDNNKEANGRTRRFLLAGGKGAVAVDGSDLVVRFEHRPLTEAEKKRFPGNGNRQQATINAASAARILKAAPEDWAAVLAGPAPTDASSDRTTLDRHLAAYTAKNSFDYFIHKNLGVFLRTELDLYLKTEVLNLDDLDAGDPPRVRRALFRMRAIRVLGEKIIAFLAQLEDFQKRLWLKKKFVLETQYCVTLDRVPEALYPEIAENEAQRAEWERLYAISGIAPDLLNGGGGASTTLTGQFLKANPHLVLDTRHFGEDFKDRLLAALSEAGSLDEAQDGLLVHGENFQALRLLNRRYGGQVQCVYIDPPYNTDASAILYKNDYKDSSWLSLMWDRLALARHCMANDGTLCVAIDDEEAPLLRLLLEQIFDRELGVVPVRSNPAGRKSAGRFSPAHEYALFFGNPAALPGSLHKTARELARYTLLDETGRYAWNNLIRHGSNDRREDRPTMFYPIYVSENDELRIPKMSWDSEKQRYEVLEKPGGTETAVWPVTMDNGAEVEKCWHRGWERMTGSPSDYRIRRGGKNGMGSPIMIDFKIRPDMASMPKTWWNATRYASANLGPKSLKELFGESEFDYAKAVGLVEDCLLASRCLENSVVFDFFAGSGTTGHAVVNLNRADGGRRKVVLVEMGDHFDAVLLPRLKKVVHSAHWKDGKPVSRKGISQFFRYLRLESYEDTMDSLVVAPPDRAALDRYPELAEDYRLRYALAEETNGSPCLLGGDFENPFTYTLSVVREGERRETPVDLPETFNLLLGLREASRRRVDGVLAIEGEDPRRERCLILWRDRGATDNAALDRWFAEHRDDFAPFDRVYVNGDHTLNALARERESWTATTLEPVFRRLMFEEA